MDRKTFEELHKFMLGFMTESAHDKEHITRVLYVALEIAKSEEKVDLDVLIASCLLHDIGREAQRIDAKVCHARAGSEMAYEYLAKKGWSQKKALHVRDCILSHRFRNDAPPKSIEAKILFDADKIDATGTLGIARTLLYQGQSAHPMYAVDENGCVLHGGAGEPPSFFREYMFKLNKLYGLFYTRRGKEIAAGRRSSATAFYEAMQREVDECYINGKNSLQKALYP